MWRMIKRLLVGQPLPTSAEHGERIGIFRALAVLSSDALSSVAYATEETLLVLVAVGAATSVVLPIALAIVGLLALLAISYRQVIFAYPSGGGAYVVAKDNLGPTASLVAAASLLVDYTLTVAVSVASGVDALVSANAAWAPHRVGIALFIVLVIVVVNLRGVRESGFLFAIPTYFFILTLGVAIVIELVHKAPYHVSALTGFGALTNLGWLVLFRAFSSGSTAVTGIEAISNGVPLFRAPQSQQAARTLAILALLLGFLFLGTSYLAVRDHLLPRADQTILSQLGHEAFGNGLGYYLLQIATIFILSLAANTSFNGFPILASILARDGYLPRQLTHRGDRLSYSNGIVVLGLMAGLLLVIFHASTTRLIPLYAIGVFISFTLSQFGLVRRWLRLREGRWRYALAVNGLGALTTLLVLVVFTVGKFTEGAWAVVVIIPLMVWAFVRIKAHYDNVAHMLSLQSYKAPRKIRNQVVVPVSGLTRPTAWALRYARTLSPDVTAVFVSSDEEADARLRQKWAAAGLTIPLLTIPSPYRSVLGPLLEYIDRLKKSGLEEDRTVYTVVTVVVPEFIPDRWWQLALHNQFALALKATLLFKPGVLVTSVPYHFSYRTELEEADKVHAAP